MTRFRIWRINRVRRKLAYAEAMQAAAVACYRRGCVSNPFVEGELAGKVAALREELQQLTQESVAEALDRIRAGRPPASSTEDKQCQKSSPPSAA